MTFQDVEQAGCDKMRLWAAKAGGGEHTGPNTPVAKH